jgi:hypothetical protein
VSKNTTVTNSLSCLINIDGLQTNRHVQALEKERVGDLLNDFERTGDPAGPESVPGAINLIANFTSKIDVVQNFSPTTACSSCPSLQQETCGVMWH